MGMNRPRSDVWPPYEPTRHVLIKRKDYRYARPFQGFVVNWKRDGREWVALVVFIDEREAGTPLVQMWFPIKQLTPLHVDPNPPRDAWF